MSDEIILRSNQGFQLFHPCILSIISNLNFDTELDVVAKLSHILYHINGGLMNHNILFTLEINSVVNKQSCYYDEYIFRGLLA